MRAPILVLDAFGVLYRPGDDVAGVLIPFVAEKGGMADGARVHTLYREASLGRMTAAAFWQAVGVDPALEDEYLTRIRLVEGVHDFLPRAATRFEHIAVLSNDVGQWSRKLSDQHGLAQAIGPWVISGDVNLRKPAPEIYQVLLERLGVEGERIIFVDDRAANLDAARPFGIRTVWMATLEETAAGPQHRVIHALEDLLAMAWG